ncbi:unnamed protein product [Rangifer tarandus platyrhynchus]|uniref:Uncharacterized protein n=1 Tax=Rangifer tarandus platyrhynchus TaxID=3082113 RepID=A0ABN9A3W0_RANTA|nr:unnamed protein product [Rangifer tarandus platyrhynchus]
MRGAGGGAAGNADHPRPGFSPVPKLPPPPLLLLALMCWRLRPPGSWAEDPSLGGGVDLRLYDTSRTRRFLLHTRFARHPGWCSRLSLELIRHLGSDRQDAGST